MILFVTSVTDGFFSKEAQPYIDKVRTLEHMLFLSGEAVDATVKKLQKIVNAINVESRVKFGIVHQRLHDYGYIQLMQFSEVPGKKPIAVSYLQYSRVRKLSYAENLRLVKDVELYALTDFDNEKLKEQPLTLSAISL